MNVLVVKNLYVHIEGKSLIENINFELIGNERLVIIGPNGAGKTVLLKALLDLLPYSGEITWAPDVRIGYVPQKIDADRRLPITYKDLYVSKCKIMKVATEEIGEVSESVGLTKEILETPVGLLSGGQFQRGLIGFALIGKPNVLLLDEPTASIDEPGEEHIYELIHRLQDRYNMAVIAVTHDLSFVYRHATKVLCLNKQAVCIGTLQEALTPQILEKLYGESYSYVAPDWTADYLHREALYILEKWAKGEFTKDYGALNSTTGCIAPTIAGHAAQEQLRRANRFAHDRTGPRRSLRRESQTLHRCLYQRREKLCHPAQRAIRPDETAPVEQLLFLDVLGFSRQPPESNDLLYQQFSLRAAGGQRAHQRRRRLDGR